MKPSPAVHLICNAHLDPVWQWRWEEGASEALATFRNAARILREYPELVFCHNEAVLYRWVERLDPGLFKDIRELVREGRWAVSGGWFLQPDLNLPGTESIIRQVLEGRRYFKDALGAEPRAAYNFDSFGHSGGLPQILVQAGFEMYIHMRPDEGELRLPADLYRWRGLDGSEIPACRISVGLYHTERDNIEDRLCAGVEMALRLGRDVPVFWGLGNHGGGATREDLRKIAVFAAGENRVRIIHSTPDRFLEAVREEAARAPVYEGDLQRTFTGCYTSLSRLKRRAVSSLGGIVQAEALAAAAWRLRGEAYPGDEIEEAWRGHLFNDFHDVITGTCVEPAERDALDLYGKAEAAARDLRLRAAAAFNRGAGEGPALPVTVLNANPALKWVPVEVEAMADYRPLWTGEWHLELHSPDGRRIVCQEEQPEALLPFNGWRRKVSFLAGLPGVGAARFNLEVREGKAPKGPAGSFYSFYVDEGGGLLTSLEVPEIGNILGGPLLEPLVVEDAGDSWGTDCRSYRNVIGKFRLAEGPRVAAAGPVRTVTRSVFEYGKSRIVMDVISYPDWPVIEFRMRILWNEERRRLKLSIPTVFRPAGVLCEVPGGAVVRPADGEEHVHGRWCLIQGESGGRPAALGVVSAGQHGLDFLDGELRLSVLRSSAYCHERGFDLQSFPAPKFADLGVHEVRILVAAGEPAPIRTMLPGLADYLAAPPAAYSHLPYPKESAASEVRFLSLEPSHIRLLACKPSRDLQALILRLQEAAGIRADGRLSLFEPCIDIPISFRPFEIKTLRVEKNGRHVFLMSLLEE